MVVGCFDRTKADFLASTSGMSAGVLNDLMRRLQAVHEETGGADEEDETAKEIEGLSKFDAAKVLISKKIEMTRKKMADRDLALKNQRGIRVTAKLKNEVYKMIQAIQHDRKMMIEMYKQDEKLSKRKKRKFGFRRRVVTVEEVAQMRRDLEIISAHVAELELMNKSSSSRNSRRNKDSNNADKLELLKSSGDNDDEFMNQGFQIVQTNEGGIPEIDISDALKTVQDKRAEQDKLLDQLDIKLTDLAQQATTIKDHLQEDNKRIEKLNQKAEKHSKALDRLNTKLDKTLKSVNQTQKLICLIFLICVGIIFAAGALGFIAIGPNFGAPDIHV